MPTDPGSEIPDPRAADAIIGSSDGGAAAELASGREWFGHPSGLATLFFTEMWERFSYYGMRAILILFMTAAATQEGNPGLGFDKEVSGAIVGLYTSLVYLLALPGGWVADKLWGQRRSVFIGGVIIMCGHFSLALPLQATFFLGLVLIVIGTGLLKPNVSTMVGDLYPEGGARRDAGFSIFYMGINLGAFAGPLLVGLVGETVSWHLGFSLAGFGMLLGLIQYRLGYGRLGTAGLFKSRESREVLGERMRVFVSISGAVGGLVVILALLMGLGVLKISIVQIAEWLGVGIVAAAAVYFATLFLDPQLTPQDKIRIGAIIWLFLLAALFWMGFEQASTSLNLFGKDFTDRHLLGNLDLGAEAPGWIPASWLQSINPILIILLAPVFGFLWTWLAVRRANPSIPLKFALGLLGLSAGFFVIAWGAANVSDTEKASMTWLVVTYFLHTTGELCLSPVGLSAMTKLAPAGRVGQMMGIWFIGSALGNLVAGLTAGQLERLAPDDLFRRVAFISLAGGVVALAASPFIKRLMRGVE
jgi:POT family proton-dependent oligopeptide transporter